MTTSRPTFQRALTPSTVVQDKEGVIRMIIQGRSQISNTFLALTVLTCIGHLIESTDRSLSIRYVRTLGQVADMLTEDALTSIQWKSFAPPKLDVNRSIAKPSCSAVSSLPSRAKSGAYSSSLWARIGKQGWLRPGLPNAHALGSCATLW